MGQELNQLGSLPREFKHIRFFKLTIDESAIECSGRCIRKAAKKKKKEEEIINNGRSGKVEATGNQEPDDRKERGSRGTK